MRDSLALLDNEIPARVPQLNFALDLGCGNGKNTVGFLQRGWQVLSIDYNQLGIDCGSHYAARALRRRSYV